MIVVSVLVPDHIVGTPNATRNCLLRLHNELSIPPAGLADASTPCGAVVVDMNGSDHDF